MPSSLHRLRNLLLSLLFLAGLAFAALVLGLRYWILPNIADYREDIATSISKDAGQKVSIGSISAGWEGLRPYLGLGDIRVYDQESRPALNLRQVEATLSWWSLFLGEIRLASLSIEQPRVVVRRTADGMIHVGGVTLNREDESGGFTDWLLRQKRIIVRDASLEWLDEQRQAPPLTLREVNLRLENSGSRHRFGLRAIPPPELALPLDVRGDLKGGSLRDFASWSGQLYLKLDNTDLAAWQHWVDLPIQISQGEGGIRMWLVIASQHLHDITADLYLKGVRAKMAGDLPELALDAVSGRLGWSDLAPGHAFLVRNLSFRAGDGRTFGPAGMEFRAIPSARGKAAQGSLKLDGLELGPLADFADSLPLAPALREQLRQLDPRGTLHDFSATWSGDWADPQRYGAQGKFQNLGVAARAQPGSPGQPGFSGLSGSFSASEQGGTLDLNSRRLALDFPGVFDHPLGFDTLTARLGWTIKQGRVEVNLNNAAYANPHLAGTAHGSYRAAPQGAGWIDLGAHLHRADARHVAHYLPLTVSTDVREWLARALLAGVSSDVRLRLKGNLDDFPFADGKSGQFEVTARAEKGRLEYAPGWPTIDDLAVDLAFRGKSMEISSRQGHTYGVRLDKVKVSIPDLFAASEILLIDGQAQGPTEDMLKFVTSSPVNAMIDGFADGIHAEGNGKFGLKLKIPLRQIDKLDLAGEYQFINNRLLLGEGFPALEQTNGRLRFTQSTLSVSGANASLLGGPVNINVAMPQPGLVQAAVAGRLTADNLRKLSSQPLLRHVQGATTWRGQLSLKKKQVDAVLTSSLQGIASDLPAPLFKRAADSVPLRLEKKVLSGDRDLFSIAYGQVLSAQLERNNGSFTRGAIILGKAPARLPQSGIWLIGTMPRLDVDQWRGMLRQPAGEKTAPAPALDGVNLNVGALDIFGKRFNDLRLNAWAQGEGWQFDLEGAEITGNVAWSPAGAGRVTARLKSFNMPPASPPMLSAPPEAAEPGELPELDVIAENFALDGKTLGRLELAGAASGRDWRVEKLRLSNPDATLNVDGRWQDWRQHPHSRFNVRLESADIGKLLNRIGYQDTFRGGSAKIGGWLAWNGGPGDFDLPSMSGNLTLDIQEGNLPKIDSGLGKLLALLSSLDFRDAVSQGFAFDEIKGDLRIRQGVMSTENLNIDGSAAKISLSGETSLQEKTLRLRARVVPMLGGPVSGAAYFFAGPQVGVAALLAQKLLKDPVGQIVANKYDISGTWSQPLVSKSVQGASLNESVGATLMDNKGKP